MLKKLMLLSLFYLFSCETGINKAEKLTVEEELNIISTASRDISLLLANDEAFRNEIFMSLIRNLDGEFTVLLRHLSEGSLSKLSQNGKLLTVLKRKPLLQLKMPFAKYRSPSNIKQSNGLSVFIYPFGKDDKKISKINGYNSNGETVTLNKKDAKNTPYLLLCNSERVDSDGILRYGRFKSYQYDDLHSQMLGLRNKLKEGNFYNSTKSFKDLSKEYHKMVNLAISPPDDIDGDDETDGNSGGGGGTYTPKEYLQFYSYYDNGKDDGWLDGYAEIVLRIMDGYKSEKKISTGTIGQKYTLTNTFVYYSDRAVEFGDFEYDEDGGSNVSIDKKVLLSHIEGKDYLQFELWEDDGASSIRGYLYRHASSKITNGPIQIFNNAYFHAETTVDDFYGLERFSVQEIRDNNNKIVFENLIEVTKVSGDGNQDAKVHARIIKQ